MSVLVTLLASSTARRMLEMAGVVAIVASMLVLVRHEHADAVAARQALAASRAQVVAVTASAAANQTALEHTAAVAAARVRELSAIRSRINALPQLNSCSGSPAVRALVDGLRDRAGSRASAAGAANPADVHR